MSSIENLYEFLIDKEVNYNINKLCEQELSMSINLQKFTESELLLAMNNIKNKDQDENRTNQAIFILFAQAIKSFKSCLILATNGFFSNTLIDCRNIVEIIFNIKYIVEEPSQKLKRANDYLSKKDYWTDDSIKHRAFLSLDKPLYQVYKILCNYSHANYMGAAQNYNGETISIGPSTNKIKSAIEIVNSTYYYLLKFICQYYSICENTFNKIHTPEHFEKIIYAYEVEKKVVDFVLNKVFPDVRLTEQQKQEWIRDFKKFTLENKRNSKSKAKGSN